MRLKDFFLFRTLHSIRSTLPSFVSKAIVKLIPVSFLLSLFEILGLAIVVPVIQIILKPEVIHTNRFLGKIYRMTYASSEIVFIVYVFVFIVLLFVVKNLLTYWASLKQTRITYEVAQRLTLIQYQDYLFQPYQLHAKDNSSILLRKIIELPFNFTSGVMQPVVILINELIVVILIVGGIILYSPLLFISIAIFLFPFFLLYGRVYRKKLRNMSIDRDAGHSEMFRKGKQSIEGFREVLLFDKFKYFQPQFAEAVRRFSFSVGHLYHLNTFSSKIIETLAVFGVLGIFVTGLLFNYNVAELASFLIAFSVASYRLIPSVNRIILSYNNIKSSEFVFEHYKTIKWTDAPEKTDDVEHLPFPFEKEFQIKNLSFSFFENQKLLSGINLTIKKGEIVGIIGKSGSGKSTLINLMLGLFAPLSGSIKVDEQEITSQNLKRWHKTISFVPQSPVLIEGTIEENIAFGIPVKNIDKERLRTAVENSGLQEYVDRLPLGLATVIGDKSLNISGGQKQRIAIARALYHNGKILIFDEPTSSLDHETEKLLTESFGRLSEKSYTVIIVTHKLNTLHLCNHIHKIKDGSLSDYELKV